MRPPTPNFACTVRKSLVIQSKRSWITLCCENLLFEEGVQPPLPLYWANRLLEKRRTLLPLRLETSLCLHCKRILLFVISDCLDESIKVSSRLVLPTIVLELSLSSYQDGTPPFFVQHPKIPTCVVQGDWQQTSWGVAQPCVHNISLGVHPKHRQRKSVFQFGMDWSV